MPKKEPETKKPKLKIKARTLNDYVPSVVPIEKVVNRATIYSRRRRHRA